MGTQRSSVQSVARRLRLGSTAMLVIGLAWGLAPAAGAEQPFEDLVANLKSPTARTRQEAAQELGKSRRREAVAPLSALVRDPEVRVRLEVVKALRNLRDLSAVPALVTSLQDGDPDIREEAIGTLVEIYAERDRGGPDRPLPGDLLGRVRPCVGAPLHRGGPLGLPWPGRHAAGREEGHPGRVRLRDRHPRRGERGARTRERDPGPRGRRPGRPRPPRSGRWAPPRRASRSFRCWPTSPPPCATGRSAAIGVLRVREAGPALREMFEQHKRRGARDARPRLRSAGSATRPRPTSSGSCCRRATRSSGASPWRGWGGSPTRRRLPAFKKDYQREKNGEVRLAYNFAITSLGDRAFLDAIVLALGSSGGAARQARDYILELGPSIAPDLYPYLNDRDPEVRGALCDVLAQLGDTGAPPRLTPLLADPNSKVADRANRAIEKLRRAGGGAAPGP